MIKHSSIVKRLVAGLVIFVGVYFFFYEPINSFFSQDDFFHLSVIMNKELSDIPSFFMSQPEEYYFFRPLSRETYNLLMYQIFGMNSFIFHLINFLLVLLNGLLVYKFFQVLKQDKKAIILALALYLFSSVHSVELYYLSSVQTLIAAAFLLAGLISYQKFIYSDKRYYWFLSALFFILAFLSHESSVVFIGLIAILQLLSRGFSKAGIIKLATHLSPFLLILFLRFVIHLTGSGLDSQSSYHSSFHPKNILNTFSWFTLWCFGMPEMLVDFATLTLDFNPNLFKFYGYYTNSVFPLFLLMVASLLLVIVSLIKNNWRNRILLFFGAGYIISLSPFLLFPYHKFVYYLTIPIIFFCTFCGLLLSKYWALGNSHKFLIITFLAAYIAVSYQTTNLNKITHWAAKRASSANFLVSDIRQRFANIPPDTAFYIRNDPEYPFIAKEWGTSSKQAFYILSGADAFKLIFNNPNIKAYYEDVTGPPKDNDFENLIIYKPSFPY